MTVSFHSPVEVEAEAKDGHVATTDNASSRGFHVPMEFEVEPQEGPVVAAGNLFSGYKRRRILEMVERIQTQSESLSPESVQNQLAANLWGTFSSSVRWPKECHEMMLTAASKCTKDNLNRLKTSEHRCVRASKAVTSLEATVPKLKEIMNKMRKQMVEDTTKKAPTMAIAVLKARGLLDGMVVKDLKRLQMRWMREPRLTSLVPVKTCCETLVGFVQKFVEKLESRRDRQLLFVQVLLEADLGKRPMFLSTRPHTNTSLEQLEQDLHAEWGRRIDDLSQP